MVVSQSTTADLYNLVQLIFLKHQQLNSTWSVSLQCTGKLASCSFYSLCCFQILYTYKVFTYKVIADKLFRHLLSHTYFVDFSIWGAYI